MADASRAQPARLPAQPWTVALPLLLAAAAVTLAGLHRLLPPEQWLGALLKPDIADIRQLLAHYSFFPRLALSLLAGAGLALAGTVFQQVLRNPLADAATLGVTGGAYLAVSLVSFWGSPVLVFGTELAALLGGGAAALLAFALAWKRGLPPLSLILAGMVIGLYCSTLSTTLILFHGSVRSIFIWGAGSLSVQGWDSVSRLAPGLAVAAASLLIFLRPLVLLGLGDTQARSLGLSLSGARAAALVLAVGMATFVVSAVGPIGFIGLIAPALARLAGARSLRRQLFWSPVFGALILWLVDQGVQWLATAREIPTGAAIALLGAPLLLALLPRLRQLGSPIGEPAGLAPGRPVPLARFLTFAMFGIVLLATLSLSLGRMPEGWHWSVGREFLDLSYWRGPRLVAAFCGGAMVAAAGTIIQRMTGNPMASPEILGISTGASLGVIALLLLGLGFDRASQAAGAFLGAALTLSALLLLSRRSGFSPERMIYVGIALATLFSGLVSVLMASGDPRMAILFRWLSGSTWLAQPADAAMATAITGAACLVLPLTGRWLDVLALGTDQARQLGLDIGRSRLLLVLATAVLTGAATLIIGPMSFVGIMAPHMARMLGQVRAIPQMAGAALIGGMLMMTADWLGRTVLFPDQMPAGLLTALIGGPYFFWLMKQRGA